MSKTTKAPEGVVSLIELDGDELEGADNCVGGDNTSSCDCDDGDTCMCDTD